jgi:hypothetical protein
MPAESTSPLKGSRTCDNVLNANQLKSRTQQEIFRAGHPAKKQINYTNYSNNTFDLINPEI